jgi:multisubunit Na+/H+ antiporter MnhB subunit
MYSGTLNAPLLQLTLETIAFLVVAGVSLAHARAGLPAVLGMTGGLLAAAASLFNLVAYAEQRFRETADVLSFVFVEHPRLYDALAWSRVAGIVLIAAALVLRLRMRTPAASPS